MIVLHIFTLLVELKLNHGADCHHAAHDQVLFASAYVHGKETMAFFWALQASTATELLASGKGKGF